MGFKIGIFVFIFIFYYIFSNVLVCLGKSVLRKSCNIIFLSQNVYIIESFSFFLGVLISTLFIVCLSYFLGLKISFYLFFTIVICSLYFNRKFKGHFSVISNKILFALIILISQIIISLLPLPSFFSTIELNSINPFDGFGAIVHSLRSGNISLFFLEKNSVPRLNQNIGQSLITTYPMFIIGKYPQVNLIVWKSFVVLNTLNLVYGILINLTSKFKYIFLGVIALLFGQTGLGFTYIQTVDTGSSLFFLANTDTYISIISFFLFYILVLADLKAPGFYNKFIILVIGFSWNFFGSQNIIISSLIFFGFFLFYKKFNFIFFLSFLALSILFGYVFGGLFALDTNFPSSNIPGLMSVINGGRLFEFRLPFLPSFYHFEFYRVFDRFFSYLPLISCFKYIGVLLSCFMSVLNAVIFVYYLLKILPKRCTLDELHFVYIFLMISIFGIFVASFFKIYGQVWELSRFYYVGNYFLIFLMTFVFLNQEYLDHRSRSYIRILYLCSFVPVLLYSIFFIYNNFNGNYIMLHTNYKLDEDLILSINERFDCMFRFSSEVGRDLK